MSEERKHHPALVVRLAPEYVMVRVRIGARARARARVRVRVRARVRVRVRVRVRDSGRAHGTAIGADVAL